MHVLLRAHVSGTWINGETSCALAWENCPPVSMRKQQIASAPPDQIKELRLLIDCNGCLRRRSCADNPHFAATLTSTFMSLKRRLADCPCLTEDANILALCRNGLSSSLGHCECKNTVTAMHIQLRETALADKPVPIRGS